MAAPPSSTRSAICPSKCRSNSCACIQEREFRAVGSLQWKKVDLRIIAATHRNLQAEVAAGRFRQDLFYRLNVFAIRLPALRDRKDDIPLLVRHFVDAGQRAGLPGIEPTLEFIDTLLSYDWPGNVRELKHCHRSRQRAPLRRRADADVRPALAPAIPPRPPPVSSSSPAPSSSPITAALPEFSPAARPRR